MSKAKEIITYIGAEFEPKLNELDKNRMLKELVRIDRDNTDGAYAMIDKVLKMIGQDDHPTMKLIREQFEHAKETKLPASASIFRETHMGPDLICDFYLLFATENLRDLVALTAGKQMDFGAILPFKLKIEAPEQ